ncbi:hypothetical protein [Ralstonia sp. ASV6]|uniref:hypothetical protein n=1 Tax=Ralstonia sp. ASV6 TaxID=2795124 RepID=UPI0018ECD43F|nr:hypothetical protein [Ralstonia sp. ASV6]
MKRDAFPFASADLTKTLLACWPLPLAIVAHRNNMHASDLTKFLNEEVPLEREAHVQLMKTLEIHFHRSKDPNKPPTAWAAGSYVLLASDSPDDVITLYDVLSSDGDVNVSIEPLTADGARHPDWRFLLYSSPDPFALQLLVFPTNSPSAVLLDPAKSDRLAGYLGPRPVDNGLYKAIAGCWDHVIRHPDEASTAASRLLVEQHDALKALDQAITEERRLDYPTDEEG